MLVSIFVAGAEFINAVVRIEEQMARPDKKLVEGRILYTIIVSVSLFLIICLISHFTRSFWLPVIAMIIIATILSFAKDESRVKVSNCLVFALIFAGLISLPKSDVKGQIIIIVTGLSLMLITYLLALAAKVIKRESSIDFNKVLDILLEILPLVVIVMLVAACYFVGKDIILPALGF